MVFKQGRLSKVISQETNFTVIVLVECIYSHPCVYTVYIYMQHQHSICTSIEFGLKQICQSSCFSLFAEGHTEE